MKPEDIFPLEAGETPIDQGRYDYHENGGLTSVVEPWCRHRTDGGEVVRALRSDGMHFILAVKHVNTPLSNTTLLKWQNLQTGEKISAEYVRSQNHLIVFKDGKIVDTVQIDQCTAFFPLMRIFTGCVFHRLLELGGVAQVLVPSITTPSQADTLFLPTLSERFVELSSEGDEEGMVGDQECKVFKYGGAQYEDGALFWLDENAILRRYEWQQNENSHWVVSLEQYKSIAE